MSQTGWDFKVVNEGSSATPLITGTPGKKIRVLGIGVNANNGTCTWKFQKSTGPTDLTGNLYFDTEMGPFVLPHSPTGWFETDAGDDLNLILVAGSAGLTGCLVYELV